MIEMFMKNLVVGFFAIVTAMALFKPTKETKDRLQDEFDEAFDDEPFDASSPFDLFCSLFAVVFWLTCWPYFVYLRIKDSK